MISETVLTIRAVSAMLSPFCSEEDSALGMEMTCPPRRSMADSKLSLVLVDGSSKTVAKIFPFVVCVIALAFCNFLAASNRCHRSFLENCSAKRMWVMGGGHGRGLAY